MKENCDEVKKSLYAGMSIFNSIKDVNIFINNTEICLNDKKYLSLYLGIIYTNNVISKYLKEKGIRLKYDITLKKLNVQEYLNLYNLYFIDIFNEINFVSIEENFNNLLSKNIIDYFNKCNGHYVYKTVKDVNKQLIK